MSAKLSRPDVFKSKYTILQLSMDNAGMLSNVWRLHLTQTLYCLRKLFLLYFLDYYLTVLFFELVLSFVLSSQHFLLYQLFSVYYTGLQGFVIEKLWVVSGVIFDVKFECRIRISLSHQDFEIFEVMCSKNGG